MCCSTIIDVDYECILSQVFTLVYWLLVVRHKLLFCLFLLSIQFSVYATSKQEVVIYAEENYRPYTWVENGQLKGIYVDILKQAFEKMEGYHVKLKAVPWERGLHMLEKGEAFALFPPYYQPKHRPYISPYSEPIFREKTILVCRKGIFTENRTRWPEDFYGLTIGQSSGYLMGGDKYIEAVRQGKITVSESLRTGQNLLMVATGRIDCYINDELAVKTEELMLSLQPRYKKLVDNLDNGFTISEEHGYLAFSNVNEDNYPYKHNFVTQFNLAIKQMKDNGEYDAIVSRYTGAESRE